MNKEEIIYRNDFVKEIWENSQRFCKEEGVDAPQYVEVDKIFKIVEKYKDKEIERLKNIIFKAHKMIYDNYGVLDKYEIDILDDILTGKELKEGKE